MPPMRTASNAARKQTAFKPPRPKNGSNTTTAKTTSRDPSSSPPRRPSVTLPPLDPSSSLSQSPEPDGPNKDKAIRPRSSETVHPLSDDPPPQIPQKLLIRLLHEHFPNAGTKISKEAMRIVEKYVETFVREAIARAAFERGLGIGRGSEGRDNGMFRDVFLEVEDLEKLAPQLLLDF